MDVLRDLRVAGASGAKERRRQRFAPVQTVFTEESQQGRSGLGQDVHFAALFR